MNLVSNESYSILDKERIEQIQQERQEYYFLGSFLRRAGLKLFAYDPKKDEIYELKIKYSNTIHCVPQDGKLIPIDLEAAKCTIDSRHDVFEALNIDSAYTRLLKFKQGKIKVLGNLRKYNENGLKLF